jgi:hypothetical protein
VDPTWIDVHHRYLKVSEIPFCLLENSGFITYFNNNRANFWLRSLTGVTGQWSARCILDIMDSTSPIAGPDPFQDDPMTSPPSQYSTHPPQTFNPSALQPTNDSSQGHPQNPSQAEDVHPFPGEAPPRQRMPHSQYYIMFSVTGIERSNVKNPIIRFDAKVPPLRFLTFHNPMLTCDM